MDRIKAEHLWVDKGYDSTGTVVAELARGINPVIPLKSKRRKSRNYDQDLYKLRPKGSFLLGNMPNQGSGTLG